MPSPPADQKDHKRPFWKKALRTAGKILAWLILIPILLLILVAILIYVPPVQNLLRNEAIGFLQKKTGTRVELAHIHLKFPIGLTLEGFHMDDLHGDTLVHVGALRTTVSPTSLFRQRIVIGSIELEGGRANIHQNADSVFNFDFIVDAFATPDTVAQTEKVDTTATDKWKIMVDELILDDLRVKLDLEPSRLGLDLVVGEFNVEFDEFSLDPQQIHVEEIALRGTRAHLRMAGNSDPPEPDTYPDLQNPMADHDIRFEEFLIEDLIFTMKDVVKEDSLWLSLAELEILPREMRLKEQRIAIEKIGVDGLGFGMLTRHVEERDTVPKDTIKSDPPWLDRNDGFRYFVRDWDLELDRLQISNSVIAMHTGSIAEPTSLLDSLHRSFEKIELELDEVAINNDRILLHLNEFNTEAPGDLPGVHLSLAIDATPAEILIQNGRVAIGENEIAFSLDAQTGDLSSAYRSPETIPIRFAAESELRLSELAPLLAGAGIGLPPHLKTDAEWDLDLLVQGDLQEMDSIRVDLSGDEGSELHLIGMVHGARDWPKTKFDLDLREFVMGSGLREILRGSLPPGTVVPQRFTMRADAKGDHGSITADLNVDSDAGSIDLKASASGITKKIPDNIDLQLKIIDLQTSRFTGDTVIGDVSLGLIAKGERLNTPQRSGTFTLDPQQLSYNGIDLHELELNGTIEGDSVDVNAAIGSEDLAFQLDAGGTWPDENDSLHFALDLLIDVLQLEKLGVTKDPLGIDGQWIGDAAFHTNGMGRFELIGNGLRIHNDQRDFVFEEFLAKGFLSDDSTAFDLNSDAIDLAYHTNLHPDSLIGGIQGRLMAIVEDDTSFVATPGKRMELEISLPRKEWLTEIVLPDLEAIELERFNGHYDSDLDELQIDIVLPKLIYQDITVNAFVVDLTAADNTINGTISVEEVERDSLRIERLSIDATTAGRDLITNLRMRDVEGDRYRIGTVLRTIDEVRELRINEDLVLNSIPWTIHSDNVLRFPDHGPEADHFSLSAEDQKLELRTTPDHLIIDLDRFRLTTITDFISTVDSIPLIAGKLNGVLQFPRSEGALLDADLTINELHALGTSIGTLSIDAEETSAKRYSLVADLQHEVNRFDLEATADLTDSLPQIEASGDLAFSDLSFLKPFVSDQLYALEGGLNGKIDVNLRNGDLALLGDLNFKDAKAGVIYTGATYSLPDERITFNTKGIHFDAFNLVDSAGNRFQLDGTIDQNADPSPTLDLRLRTDRFQFVSSTSEDNENFYGDLFTGMDLKIGGNANDPVIDGSVSILGDTYISIVLPGSEIEIVDHKGIVVFTDDLASLDTLDVRSDSEILADSLKAQMPGASLDLDIHISPEATFAIVLDPVTGDAATVSAEADLEFRFGNGRDMWLSGPLTIEGGGYTLNFHGLVKKEFELVKGGTVIWSGDPTGARMDVQARYISNTAPYALVANASGAMTDAERNRLQARLPFEVLIGAGGRIDDPEIEFGLDLPRMMRNSYPQVDSRLDELAQPANKDELDRQVFALLVLNSFIIDDPGSQPGGRGLAESAARNSVNNMLSNQLNKLTGKYVQGVEIDLGVNTYDQSEGGEAYQRTTVDYNVRKRVLDDRLTFEVGGSIGMDEDEADVNNMSSTRRAQYAIMYDLTEDGRYRLRGFHENAFDLYDGEITRSGIAIMYSKEFEENAKERQRRREQLKREMQRGPILPQNDQEEEENE